MRLLFDQWLECQQFFFTYYFSAIKWKTLPKEMNSSANLTSQENVQNLINQQYRYLFLTPVSLFIVSHFCTRASGFQYLCVWRIELLYFLFSLAGVPKFILISVHDYNLPQFLLESAYFTGKRKAESEVLSKYPNSGNY